jgi:putative SOS response-associated peptidase YedK
MPVIIERKDYARWLGVGDPRQAGTGPGRPPVDLLRPFPAEQMIAWKVDKAVGNVGNDSAQLLEAPPEEPMLGFVADPQQP